jgi:type VI secretion system protein ImpK
VTEDPFAEPETDRTVIRPAPGGRRRPAMTPPAPSATTAPQAVTTAPQTEPTVAAFSVSPLCVAAAPLLQLLAGLGTLRRAPDVWKLRERAVQELTAFERRAQDAGIAMDLLRPAHYALCASIDDIVLNTPWGATSGWANQALVKALHPTAHGTDQFFEQLQQMRKAPKKFLPVIELMFLCISLGFIGRYRQARGGELEQIRSDAHAAIASQTAAAEPELSRRWRGVIVPYQPARYGLPVWVALAAALAVCGGLLFWTSTSLNAASDGLQAQALAAPPDHMPQVTRVAIVQPLPPSPPPAEPTARDRLRTNLQSDIDRGAVTLIGTATAPIIRIAGGSMFEAGNAIVQSASLPMLGRIAAALRSESGSLKVIDYTDNQPVRSVRFPSNFQLSAARANAVRTIIARDAGDATRVSAEGRADAEPIASNATAEGREQNRRIEIVLHGQD